jgi:hypothetical protein
VKKISTFILVLVVTFLILAPDSGYASSSTPSMEEINRYLFEQGLPHENIKQMPDEYKISLYRDGAKLVALDNVVGSFEETKSTEKIPTKEHPISSLATLNNWTGSLQAWEVKSGKKDIVRHRLFYQWNWAQGTFFNLKDKFGIAWTDGWDAIPATAAYSYTVKGRSEAGAITSRTYNYTGYSDYTPGNGLGWTVDMLYTFNIGSTAYYSMGHSGYGTLDIVIPHNGSGRTDSSSAVGQFFHKRGQVNGTLSFNTAGTPGVSISWETQYDSSPPSPKQWYWYHRDY